MTMANKAPEEKSAIDTAEKSADEERKNLIAMTHPKHGVAYVHPSTVASHVGAGWKVK